MSDANSNKVSSPHCHVPSPDFRTFSDLESVWKHLRNGRFGLKPVCAPSGHLMGMQLNNLTDMIANGFAWEQLEYCVRKASTLFISGMLRLESATHDRFDNFILGDVSIKMIRDYRTIDQIITPVLPYLHKLVGWYIDQHRCHQYHHPATMNGDDSKVKPPVITFGSSAIANAVIEELRKHGNMPQPMRVELIGCRLETSACSWLSQVTDLKTRDAVLPDDGAEELFRSIANGTSSIRRLVLSQYTMDHGRDLDLTHLPQAIRQSSTLIQLDLLYVWGGLPRDVVRALSESHSLEQIAIGYLEEAGRELPPDFLKEYLLPLLKPSSKARSIKFRFHNDIWPNDELIENIAVALQHNTKLSILKTPFRCDDGTMFRGRTWERKVQPILDANLYRPKAKQVANEAAVNGNAALLSKLLCHPHTQKDKGLIFDLLQSNNEQVVQDRLLSNRKLAAN